MRRALGLRGPGPGAPAATAALAAAGVALLVAAAAQPALVHPRATAFRTDAELFVVLDTSGSMAARPAPAAPSRLARARGFAVAFRGALPGIPAGVASFTDRTLPHLLPSNDVPTFDATVREAVGIDRPPPRRASHVATTYSALSDLVRGGAFSPRVRRRLLVLVTDGESAPYDPAALTARLGRGRTSLLVVRVWSARERIYRHGRDVGYRPDPRSTARLEELGALSVGGRVFAAGQARTAAAAARAWFGTGPTAGAAAERDVEPLTLWFALAALVPLGLVVTRAGGARRRFRLRPASPRARAGRA